MINNTGIAEKPAVLNRGKLDGSGMVNYPGIMLDALRGDWHESEYKNYI